MEVKSHTKEEILKAAHEASVWCELTWNRMEPRSSLRTLEFSPEILSTSHFYTVENIISARRYKLEDLNAKAKEKLTIGNILVYEPDMNISDGISEAESFGYFDTHDCPPWDTWVGYVQHPANRYLLSWVPDSAVSLVNDGAAINCVECFYWLSQSEDSWAKEIQLA